MITTVSNQTAVTEVYPSPFPIDPMKTPTKKKTYETQSSVESVDKRALQNIQLDTHTIPGEQQCKRAPKRSVSPDNGNGKVSKYNNVHDTVDCKTSESKEEIDSERIVDIGTLPKSKESDSEFVNADIVIKLEDIQKQESVPSSTLSRSEPMKIESTEICQPNFIDNENIKVEYPIDIDDINLEHVTNKFNTSSIASDNLSTFCTNDDKLDSIYKIQNFEGVLQIQPNSLTLEREQCELVSSMQIEEIDDIIGEVNVPCDDSSDSNAPLVDCSGENSADTAVEELEPTIQNLDPMEDDPIEQKFTDAENYVLESGEISADSGGI